MCYVSYQIDRYLADEDRAAARDEWLGLKGEDDSYGRYAQDAAEELDGALSAKDNEVLADFGMDGYALLSAAGKEAIADKALELAIEDGFSRYEQ